MSGRMLHCIICLKTFPDVFPSFQSNIIRNCPFCCSMHWVFDDVGVVDMDRRRHLIWVLSKSVDMSMFGDVLEEYRVLVEREKKKFKRKIRRTVRVKK